MKNCIALWLTGYCIFFFNTACAVTPPNGWYMGLWAGLTLAPKISFTLPTSKYNAINSYLQKIGLTPFSTSTGRITHAVGGAGGGDIGFRYCGFRIEGELLLDGNAFNKATINNIVLTKTQNTSLALPYSNLTFSGGTFIAAGLGNIFFDFYDEDDDDTRWVPYIGAGIGYGNAQNKVKVEYINPTSTGTITTELIYYTKHTSTGVAQAIAGLSFLLSENFSIALDYRYITTMNNIKPFNLRLQLQTFNLNINYWFNSDDF